MRQHITIQQLFELSKKGRDNLKKYWKPKVGDLVIYNDGYDVGFGIKDYEGEWKIDGFINDIDYSDDENYASIGKIEYNSTSKKTLKKMFPLFSIGQMIEFLGEDYQYAVISSYGDQETTITEVVKPDDLCDELWEAVKEVLNK